MNPTPAIPDRPGAAHSLRYYDLLVAGMVAVLLCSNLIGPAKVCQFELPLLGAVSFGAGNLFFPISYIFGDVLTEVYGYAVLQPALETAFGSTWRIVLASIVAYWVGDFVNSYVLARLKVWTAGRRLWLRTIGSTMLGQAADSLLFYPIAFYGIWTHDALAAVMLFNLLFKIGIEVLFTPLTYAVVGYLKRSEGLDAYDRGTDFTPFSLKV